MAIKHLTRRGAIKRAKRMAFHISTPTSVAGELVLDLRKANSFNVALTENISTITVYNPPAAGREFIANIRITQNSVAAKTVAIPDNWYAPGGTDMVMTSTLSKIDYITLRTIDGGVTYTYEFKQDFGGVGAPTPPSPTADIVVRADGTGDYTTVQAALNAVTAGQVIEIQAATLGGAATFVETLSCVTDGTSGNEIVVRGRATDFIRIFAASGANTLSIASVDYLLFQNITFGDADLSWQHGTAGDPENSGGRTVSSGRNINITGTSHHIDFQDCVIYGGGSRSGVSLFEHFNYIGSTAHTIRFLDTTIQLAGDNADPKNTNDRGNLFTLDGTLILLINCIIAQGGHDNLWIRGNQFIVRNCRHDADWTSRSTGYPGARACDISSSDDRGAANTGPSLYEHNIFTGADNSIDQSNQSATKFTGYNIIFRNNYFWDNDADDMNISNDDTDPNNSIERCRVYHNTSYGAGVWLRMTDTGSPKTNYLNHQFYNNQIYAVTGLSFKGDNPNGRTIRWDATSMAQQGTPDNWIGAKFSGNNIKTATGSVEIELPFNTTSYDVAGAETEWPLSWFDNTEVTVSFVNAGALTKAGFQLDTGSNGIDDAVPMAHVTTTENSTTISLDDVWWLYDGFTADIVSYFSESPDYICITATGTDPNVSGTHYQLTAGGRNTSTSEVTLTASANVTDGDDVYWSDGTTAYTNVGAQEL